MASEIQALLPRQSVVWNKSYFIVYISLLIVVNDLIMIVTTVFDYYDFDVLGDSSQMLLDSTHVISLLENINYFPILCRTLFFF